MSTLPKVHIKANGTKFGVRSRSGSATLTLTSRKPTNGKRVQILKYSGWVFLDRVTSRGNLCLVRNSGLCECEAVGDK